MAFWVRAVTERAAGLLERFGGIASNASMGVG